MNRILKKLIGVDNKADEDLLDQLDEKLKKVLSLTLDDLEAQRLHQTQELVQKHGSSHEELKERYRSGYGIHEVMDRSFLLAENIEAYLMEHPGVALDPKMYQLAVLANALLNQLYQEAGRHAE